MGRNLVAPAALTMLLLAACTAAPAHEAARGPHPTLVSLNPCTDAIVAEVADPGQILALSAYSSDPASSSMEVAQAKRFAAVRSVEEVAALRPDLVIDSNFTAPTSVAALHALGFRLEQFPIAATVEQSRDQVRQIAALAGHPERGERLVGRIDAALAAARPPSGAPLGAVVWESGGMVAGSGTLISDLLARTGFANLAPARGLGQADLLPLERLIAQPPQVVLVAGNAAASEDRMLAHPALRRLKAMSTAPLDPRLLYCGGPTIVKAAARLAEVRRNNLGTVPKL